MLLKMQFTYACILRHNKILTVYKLHPGFPLIGLFLLIWKTKHSNVFLDSCLAGAATYHTAFENHGDTSKQN